MLSHRTTTISFFHLLRRRQIVFLLISFLFLVATGKCQDKVDSIFSRIDVDKFARNTCNKAEKLQDRMLKKSLKTLDKFGRISQKLDSNSAKELQSKIASLKNSLKHPGIPGKVSQYVPTLDSLHTGLAFLDRQAATAKVKEALSKTALLQQRFEQAEEIKKFLKEKREQLKEQLEKLGFAKELRKINKQVYYYSAQIQEYKEILKDPKKIEKKTLELLSKTKLFQDFFRKNSALASLFRIPGDPNDPAYLASLRGLQTRAQVNALVQQQIMSAGPNGRQAFQQNFQAAQSQLNQLKNKISQFGGGSSDAVMPEGFKPNTQKTKTFMQRLEYGANIQSQKSNNLFPTTSDIGLSLGYKLNDKSVIGVGASYKMGWGRGWNHLSLTSEGVGLRSYVDWKIKGSLWISGGFEMNYKSAFNSISQLHDYSAWQRSGLIGISKKLPIKTKFFKNTKLMLLWDFLSYREVPRAQPVVFRVGYNFK